MANPTREQQEESQFLKATFFTSRMLERGIFDLHRRVGEYTQKLDNNLDWDFDDNTGIDIDIFKEFKSLKLSASHYFCHPNTLIAKPEFLTYYRCLGVYSQKALKSISGVSKVEKIELGESCSSEQALRLSQAINTSLCLVYKTLVKVTPDNAKAMMYATFGASTDGSWRNAIGQEGERIIRAILLSELFERGELELVSTRDGNDTKKDEISLEWIEANSTTIKSATCINSSILEFSSEPDVRCINPKGKTTAGIEVKAGLDPAGALERLGAMQKSFEKIHKDEPDAETILIASCITDEVQRRLNESRSVTRVLSLTDIVNNKKGSAREFANYVRAYLNLVQKRF